MKALIKSTKYDLLTNNVVIIIKGDDDNNNICCTNPVFFFTSKQYHQNFGIFSLQTLTILEKRKSFE